MGYFLFFSYATDDDPNVTQHKRQVFDDLVAEIKSRHDFKCDAQEVGFLDADMVLGADWGAELGTALRTCRVFVYLQEATYFHFNVRPWCGREWHVFQSRVDDYLKGLPVGTRRPALAIPIIWQRSAKLPEVAEEIQFRSRGLGELYSRLGLSALKAGRVQAAVVTHRHR